MNERIVEVIRKHRIEKGVSLTFMARKLGYKSVSGYANIEYGLKKISLDDAIKAFQLLDIPPENFFGEKLPEKSKAVTV